MKTSPESNECARAIVALVEKSTGKTLSMGDCLNIIVCVQTAMNSKVNTALDIVAESRSRMNRKTPAERAELERIARQKISEGAKAVLRQSVHARTTARMLSDA